MSQQNGAISLWTDDLAACSDIQYTNINMIKPSWNLYCSDLNSFVWCCEGGMEAPETTKPDHVFDGELNFEKGASVYWHSHIHFVKFVWLMPVICSCHQTLGGREVSGGGEGSTCLGDKVYLCQSFPFHIYRSSFCATRI